MIFSRGRRGGRHSRDEDEFPEEQVPEEGLPDDALPEDVDLGDGDLAEAADIAPGPYDVTEAPAGVDRIDLGSLQIPPVDGVEIRVRPNPDGTLEQLVLVHGDSMLQLAAYAAPRSSGIWDEVRTQMRAQMAKDGATVREVEGDYGTELRARLTGRDGPVDLRVIGVDGPRWMVQAIYQGPAAVDPAAAGPLADCLEGLVVDRGREAMPVQAVLPLRLPKEIAEQISQAAGPVPGTPGADRSTPGADREGPSANGRPGRPGGRRPAQRPRRSR